MKTWRITGSDLPVGASAGSRCRPARRASRAATWPSASTARSISCSQAMREAGSLRQEHHADAVLARRRAASTPCCRHLGAEEGVGDLDQDAGAVALQRVGADRAAMGQVLEDLQALLDDGVRLAGP